MGRDAAMSAVPGDGTPPGGGPQPGPDIVPVCPRHPQREAYVRCQRCERPVCPECQRPAAVGIQCVDCVRDGARSVRTARSVVGGRAGSERPVVTQTIVGLNVLIFVVQLAGGTRVTNALYFWPPAALAEPWRFLTAAFLHSTSFWLHIVFNMYILWTIGPYLEALFGRARFAALYLLCALGGSVGYFLLAVPSAAPGSSWLRPVVGASGAVFGLFAALLVVNRRLHRDVSGVIAIVLINLVIGFIPGLGIAWQAHLGGLVTGAVVAAALMYTPPRARTLLHPLAIVGVAALLLALVMVKVATLPAGLLV